MTAIKNGVRTTLRTPGKTLLFSLILTALAVLICISFCVFAAVRGYIRDCDEYYHTVVNMEFIGKDYPDGFVYDEAAASAVSAHRTELDALASSDAVIRFEPASHMLAEIEGLTRTDKFVYDLDSAVFYIYVMGYDENGGSFLVSITDVLYSRTDVNGKMIMMRTASMNVDERPGLNLGERYLVCGHFFTGTSSYLSYFAEPMTFTHEGKTATLPERIRTDELTPEVEADYRALAEQLRARNNGCPVQATAAIDDVLPFHQQELTLREGRLFEPAEYDSAAKVCILSNRIADALGLAAGDEVRLSLRTASGDLYVGDAEPAEFIPYTVVGVYDRNDNYPFQVFVPDAGAAHAPIRSGNGFRLGIFRIKNTDIAAFLAQAKGLEQYGFRFTAYDQGYSAVVEPMSELMLISVIFLAICAALTAGALSLQCHIFISRQREAAQTMIAMGSGKAHVRLYFLSAAAMLSVPAATVGCVLGKLTENAVFDRLERFAAQFAEQDLRFSSSRLTLIRTLTFSPHVSPAVYAAAGAALLLGVFLFTLLFCRGVMKDRAARKRRRRMPRTVRRVRRSTRLSGTLKYALLSVRRNGIRTAAVLLLCLLTALFFGRLTASLDGYRDQLAAVRENTALKGHATDSLGRKLDGLLVGKPSYDSLSESGLLSGIQISRNLGRLRFSGIPVTADGVTHEIDPPKLPESSFGVETMIGQMYDEPAFVMTSSVRNSTVFYYAEPTSVSWLDGFDEAAFLEQDAVCVMPGQLMTQYGVSLGDTVVFIRSYDNRLSTATLKVVGSYLSAAGDETIFAPLNPDEQGYYYYRNRPFDSLVFTLDDASKLDALRDALEDAGFTPVRTSSSRFFAVIDDEVYLDTTHSMERQIKYVSVLYDSLYVLTGIIGFVLAWLLVSSRRKEIAVMRALGTQPVRMILIFFIEQLLLCGAGLGLGVLLQALRGAAGSMFYLLVSGFFTVWMLSTLLCLLVSVTKQAYAALAEPE